MYIFIQLRFSAFLFIFSHYNIIDCLPQNYAENLVTIREVFDEIKDPELKNYVLAFPVPVAFREPNQKSIDFGVFENSRI